MQLTVDVRDKKYWVTLDDGIMKVSPPPISDDELSDVKRVAKEILDGMSASLGPTDKSEIHKERVAIEVFKFLDTVHEIQAEHRSPLGSVKSVDVTFNIGGGVDIQIFNRENVSNPGELECYVPVLKSVVSMWVASSGYDPGSPRAWYVRHSECPNKPTERCIYDTFNENTEVIKRLKAFITSFCTLEDCSGTRINPWAASE